MSSLDEARERLAIAGSTAWDSQYEEDRKWIRVQLASARMVDQPSYAWNRSRWEPVTL